MLVPKLVLESGSLPQDLFFTPLDLGDVREAVLARLDAPTRGRVETLVADALRADPPPTDEDRAAFDHFRRTGEVLGAAPPAAAEE